MHAIHGTRTQRPGRERGTDSVPQFSVFFDEVKGDGLAGRDKDRLIRVREANGTVRYYDLRKE